MGLMMMTWGVDAVYVGEFESWEKISKRGEYCGEVAGDEGDVFQGLNQIDRSIDEAADAVKKQTNIPVRVNIYRFDTSKTRHSAPGSNRAADTKVILAYQLPFVTRYTLDAAGIRYANPRWHQLPGFRSAAGLARNVPQHSRWDNGASLGLVCGLRSTETYRLHTWCMAHQMVLRIKLSWNSRRFAKRVIDAL